MGVVRKLLAVVGGGDADHGPYECQQCGAQFHQQYHSCPHCNTYRVERTDWTLE